MRVEPGSEAVEARAHVIDGGARSFWSPDGSQFNYLVLGRDGLYVADADGSNVQAIPVGFSGPWHPGTNPA